MNTKAVIEHITAWLKNYALQTNMNGFVIGISGGIDSAVVSTLAAQTGLKTLLIDLPIRQHPTQLQRSQEHIQWLQNLYPTNTDSLLVDLTNTFESFEATVNKESVLSDIEKLAFANARSRMRMMTLYYYGQLHKLLVTGTGNKIEDFGVGFFTKYGDGGVDISPIADLTKTQVFDIAKTLNIIPSIQKAIPTDGLWDEERTDEAQMGASYPELEWAMQMYDSHQAEDFSGRQKEVFEIYTRLHKAMQHKINPIPICNIPKEFI